MIRLRARSAPQLEQRLPRARYKYLGPTFSARMLGVTPGRAKTINRMVQRLSPPTISTALRLAHAIDTWETRRGTPLKPTSKLNLLSALATAMRALTGIDLTPMVEIRGLARTWKKEAALHVRRQALPATLADVRSAVRDGSTALIVRQAIALAWGLALRHADLTVLQWKDVTSCTDDIYRLRFRGLKGSEIGSRLHFRFVRLHGLLSVLRPLFAMASSQPPDAYVFETVTRARLVYALRKENDEYTAHSLRRGCATHLANRGVSIKRISTHLGHKEVDTTRLYVAPTAWQRESLQTLQLTDLAIYAARSRR